jgi:hypothetical protein
MVAYDDHGRVIGIETTPREERPQHPLPGEIVHLTATADGIGTLELRANKTREGGECWAVRGSGAVTVNAGACVGTSWTYAPLRLGTVPDPPVFLYGRVRGDVGRLTLRYADGATSDVSPRDGGYVLIALPVNHRSSDHQLVEIIGRDIHGRVIARIHLQPR